MIKQVNKEQIKAIHTALHAKGMMDQKADLVMELTNGRTPSTRALTWKEANALLMALNGEGVDPSDRMRKKILAICHDLGWYLEPMPLADYVGKKVLDFARINAFLTSKHGPGKELNDLTPAELNKAVSAFQALREYDLKKRSNQGT